MLRAAPIFLIKAFVPHGLFGNCFKTFVVCIYIYKAFVVYIASYSTYYQLPLFPFLGEERDGEGGEGVLFFMRHFFLSCSLIVFILNLLRMVPPSSKKKKNT